MTPSVNVYNVRKVLVGIKCTENYLFSFKSDFVKYKFHVYILLCDLDTHFNENTISAGSICIAALFTFKDSTIRIKFFPATTANLYATNRL